MFRTTSCLLAFVGALSVLTPATSAQLETGPLLDGEYWQGKLSGAVRIVEFPLTEGDENPAAWVRRNAKLAKQTIYLRTDWDEESQSYTVSTYTENAEGDWIERPDAGTLAPFGIDFPESKDAIFEMEVDLDPATEGGGPGGNILDVSGLVTLKIKEDKKNPAALGIDEVQAVDTGNATSGTYRLNYDGQVTSALAFNEPLGDVESALESLINIGESNVEVSNSAGGYTVTFVNLLGQQDVGLMTVDSDMTDGDGVAVNLVTEGADPVPQGLKSASMKLEGVGSTMEGEDIGEGPTNNELVGNPKFSAKRVRADQLPFPTIM